MPPRVSFLDTVCRYTLIEYVVLILDAVLLLVLDVVLRYTLTWLMVVVLVVLCAATLLLFMTSS